ncbi:MAG: hypothetical protein A3J79_06000 [Elusimicrobia bacterium RIFOXYB2_FULL_62_6]|nr:MAG: hypothetical protein A3J79_06000 [Elusimicrobia bacterium RIFOXYB2_FULL_62_6]
MSLFPPQDKDGQIKFVLAKGLPYRRRMAIIAALLLAGFAVQVVFSFVVGLFLLLAGSLLGMVKGYDAKPKLKGSSKWERVTPDEYTKIRLKADQLKSWDEDCFDITSTSGVLCFGGLVFGLVIGYLVLSVRFGFPQGYWVFVGLDAVAVLLPHWFTGVREYLKQDKLIIKISLLERMMGELSAPSDAQVFPMLALAETAGGKQVPEDARLLVKIVGAPQEFYGMQVQVSVNTVQGKDYPYLYCVLIGKAGAKLLRGYEEFLPATDTSFLGSISSFLGLGGGQAKLVCEPDSRDDVDILVVRQEALRNTGFSTGPAAAAYIVNTCLNIARGLLQKPAPPKSPTSVKV